MVKIQVNSQGKAYKTSSNKYLKPTSFSGDGEFLVMVIDYDGTVLKQDYLNTGDVFTMPTPPTHKGLVFQEWSAPLQIVNNTVTVGIDDCIIGAVYTTASGKNEFDITVNSVTGLEFTLYMDGTKDWGDGTSDTATTHTYAQEGNYTITCDGSNITTLRPFGQSADNYNCTVTAIRLANLSSTNTNYAFAYMNSLRTITIPKGYTGSCPAWFYGARALRYVIFPTTIGKNLGSFVFREARSPNIVVLPYGFLSSSQTFRAAYSLSYAILPSTCNGSLGTYTYSTCYNLQRRLVIYGDDIDVTTYFLANTSSQKVIFMGNVSSVGASAFQNSFALTEIDFTHNTSVPTLSDVSAFTGINDICKIKVPKSLEAEWKAATNWSTYADYIVGV